MNNQQQYHVKEKKQQIKDYQSYTAYPRNDGLTSQAIDWGLRTPRTQQHLQKTSPQLSPSEQQ